MPDRICTECSRPAVMRGFCEKHYRQRLRNGDFKRPTTIERYESKVDRSGGPDSCHPWTEALFVDSDYGHFWADGRSVRAHRWAYETFVGPIPDGLVIRHSCDNPPCQNLRHMSLGTNADNSADMVARGRTATNRGERSGLAKLTEAQVRQIRTLWQTPGRPSQQSIADQFGVTRPLISLVVNRKVWTHI